jgi:hypothetical protein
MGILRRENTLEKRSVMGRLRHGTAFYSTTFVRLQNALYSFQNILPTKHLNTSTADPHLHRKPGASLGFKMFR